MVTKTKTKTESNFIQLCTSDKRIDKGLCNLVNSKVDRNKKSINELSKNILSILNADPYATEEAELDKLFKHPDIKNIKIDGETIYVRTGNISLIYKGQSIEIGQFQISIYADYAQEEGDYPVKIENKTRRKMQHDHPHIVWGQACWGNIGPIIHDLAAKRKFSTLICLCIEYLKSYNENDAGAPLPTLWLKKREYHGETQETEEKE